jgi:hypothetical protein
MLQRALPNHKKDSQTVAWDFEVFLNVSEFPPAHGPLHFPRPLRNRFLLSAAVSQISTNEFTSYLVKEILISPFHLIYSNVLFRRFYSLGDLIR